MRTATISFLLIISICHRIGLSQQQTNFDRHNNKQSRLTNKSRVKSLGQTGQEEYYIPSYSTSQQQKPQEFIYPNNFENAYQFAQYKYSNRVPSTIGQKLWASPLYANYKHKSRIDERSLETGNDYISDGITNTQYRNEKAVLQEDNVDKNENNLLNSNLKASIINSKVRDFDDEQQNLNTNQRYSEDEYEQEKINKLRHALLGPVMRRKSATNSDNAIHSSQLQLNEQKSIPIALARQQQTGNSNNGSTTTLGDVYFVAIVACISAVAIFSVISAGYCFYRVQQSNKAAADVDYPAYGVVGPASKETNTGGNTSPSGDRKLAQSAQMYHYHHQKQQMIASEKAVTPRHTSASDVESDEENEEGEYTVYECPGLAPTGEMEVKNPLFHDDITPVSSPPVNNNTKEK